MEFFKKLIQFYYSMSFPAFIWKLPVLFAYVEKVEL